MSQTAGVATHYPLERFTDQAKRALSVAQTEAERSGKTYIGTEHLLLSLFQVDGAMAPQILADLGVEIETVRGMIDSIVGQSERVEAQQVAPTSRVKRAIEIAFEEAQRARDRSVGTQYLLVALAIEGEGIASHVLDDLAVTPDRVREITSRLAAAGMREGEPPPDAPPPPPGGGTRPSPDPRRMTQGLDDLTALGLLAALQDRFGTTTPPPPPLLKLSAELRRVRDRKQAAVSAQDYEAAKRLRDEELRLEADAAARLDAWRHQRG